MDQKRTISSRTYMFEYSLLLKFARLLVFTDRAVVFNNSGDLAAILSVSATEVGYLSQVSSDIQAQINSKLDHHLQFWCFSFSQEN